MFSFASFPLSYQLMTTVAALWRDMRATPGQWLMLALVTFDFLLIALLGLYISTRHVAAISAADARR